MRLIVACVWTGDKYGPEYVSRLFSMVERYLSAPFEKVCITDHRQAELPLGVQRIASAPLGLTGWWAKMMLFAQEWRRDARVLYLDLDTVIVGDITSLAELAVDFAICANFARVANPEWPCRYGSCVMVINPKPSTYIFDKFLVNHQWWIQRVGKLGDQKVIEELIPNATYLQDCLPHGFFMDRRELMKHPNGPRAGTRMVVFAGPVKPTNSGIGWIEKAWR